MTQITSHQNCIESATTKKLQLKRQREEAGGDALTAKQLLAWLDAVEKDHNNGTLTTQDYTMFHVTLAIGDRKSETYGLQWCDIDLVSSLH